MRASVVQQLLDETGLAPSAVRAIGAHGQTVRHRPGEFDETGYTLQINSPAALAEWTGIDVVADFRSRDLAAGGQGAPLVPAFHRALFGQDDHAVAVLNIGGIANLSLLPAGRDAEQIVLGFDCGPGNALMDHWCQSHIGEPFDRGGQWAASGQVLPELLDRLLAGPYFSKAPPKSTGRDLFNPAWLATHLGAASDAAPVDVQATLAELTASACAADVQRHAIDSKELIVCGGGALNDHLVARLRALLPGLEVVGSNERRLPPQQVEAAAFAHGWLARRDPARAGQSGQRHRCAGRPVCSARSTRRERGRTDASALARNLGLFAPEHDPDCSGRCQKINADAIVTRLIPANVGSESAKRSRPALPFRTGP